MPELSVVHPVPDPWTRLHDRSDVVLDRGVLHIVHDSVTPQQARTDDLLLVWNHTYDPKHHHQGERRPLASAISRDDGTTWENVKVVEPAPKGSAAYAAVYFRGETALLSYYYQPTGIGGASGVRLKQIPVRWFYE